MNELYGAYASQLVREIHVQTACETSTDFVHLPLVNRWIWLDAVAINQNDIGERNHQVAMMKEIYSRAHRVLIYAGEESHSSDKLLRFLGEPKNDAEFRALQRQQERLRRHRFSPNLKDFHVTMGIWPHHRYYDLGDLQGAMARLLSRPWFRRTWVLQEAYLAARATMIVGEKTLDWSLMCKPRLIECCLYKEEDNATLPGVLEWMERQRANDIDLLFALKTTRTCLATDPRDKVFALLGLLHDPSALGFEVNYSWTLKEVLTQVAAHLITTSNSIGILRYAGGTSSSSSIPSWAPNWSSESGDSLTAQFTSAVTPDTSTIWGYVAERKSLMPISSHNLHHNPLTDMRFATSMVVSGVCLDTIQYLLDDEFMETRCHFENDEGFTRETKQKAFPCDCKHSFLARLFSIGPADDVSTVYSHNLGEWIYPVLFRTGAISTCGHCTDSRVFGSSNSSAAGNIWASEDNVPLAEAFNIKEMNVFGRQRELQGTNKTSFQTHLTLGFGPKSVQCGDTVWRIRGLDVPLILRRCGENWQVVGECYLHGAERFVTQDQVEESISLR